MFYHHLINLPSDSLASQIAATQEHLGFPGLIQACKLLIEHYELPNIQLKSKLQWKNLVHRAIVTANRSDIIDKAKGYKKN